MIKLFVIDTNETEYHIYAIDTNDALNTFDGNIEDINHIAEYESASKSDTIH
jgi:hypothetical protein|tara:strand:+ start:5054 stop:5209 length:156 start_codon:yes stop_codon:yes gene_type:complete